MQMKIEYQTSQTLNETFNWSFVLKTFDFFILKLLTSIKN